ncbi:MAG: L,D-transpeptidase family protein, partial [Thermoleophilia bacterium]|nr:L,D-transpeptidase family protein [Thermoleophilia bacterium]
PDALAAGPYLARLDAILLLTKSTGTPVSISTLLVKRSAEVNKVDFFGLGSAASGEVLLLLSVDGLPAGFAFPTLRQGSVGAEVAWLEQKLADLTYRPGKIDGVFDKRTYQAVVAFEKWEGLSRDGVVGIKVWTRLFQAQRPTAKRSGAGNWIEVNKTKQVLLYVKNGTVARTLPVSTGSPDVGIATPSGTFTVYAKSGGWDGPRYKPLYLRGILAIHGYPSVPPWPASHGCIRVTLWDQDEFYPLIPVGTKVYVYQ